jgi:peptidoglycan/xylan/chitin deacetylase (PgdA/CDA1 family)
MSKRSIIEKIIRLTAIKASYPLNYMIPVYHSVSDEGIPHIKHVINYKSRKQFERDIDYMAKNFQFTDWDFFRENIEKPASKPLALMTFDDGFYEFKDIVLRILERKGIYAINFINPAFIGNKDLMFRCKISLLIEKCSTLSSVPSPLLKFLGLKNDSAKELIEKLKSINYNNQNILTEIAKILEIDFSDYLKNNKVYLNHEDLTEIKNKGYGIAAHSWDHPYYHELPMDKQLRNTNLSLDYMKENNFLDDTFAFPFTDFGVKNDFFVKLFNENNDLKYTFGSAGVKLDSFSKNLQRVPMENGLSAEEELKFQNSYFMLKKFINKNTIIRE